MPVEIVGEAGTPGASREWTSAEAEIGIKLLKRVCGEPSPEMELEIQWRVPADRSDLGGRDAWRALEIDREA